MLHEILILTREQRKATTCRTDRSSRPRVAAVGLQVRPARGHFQRDSRWAATTDVRPTPLVIMTTVTISIRLRNVVADVTAVMIRRGRDTAAGRRNTLGGGGTNIISIIILLYHRKRCWGVARRGCDSEAGRRAAVRNVTLRKKTDDDDGDRGYCDVRCDAITLGTGGIDRPVHQYRRVVSYCVIEARDLTTCGDGRVVGGRLWPSDTRARVSDCTRRADYVIMILLLKLFRTPTDYRRTWPAALCWHSVDIKSVARRQVWKTADVTIIDCALRAIFFLLVSLFPRFFPAGRVIRHGHAGAIPSPWARARRIHANKIRSAVAPIFLLLDASWTGEVYISYILV